jgi:uncharacterized membrane protein YciS (DUF1049 family)
MTTGWLLSAMLAIVIALASVVGTMIHSQLAEIKVSVSASRAEVLAKLTESRAEILAILAIHDIRIRTLETERERRR